MKGKSKEIANKKEKEMELKVELRKLPKDILIEIIEKGFDMEHLSYRELYKMHKESKEKLNKKIKQSSVYKDEEKVLFVGEDHKVVITWAGNTIRMFFKPCSLEASFLKGDQKRVSVLSVIVTKNYLYDSIQIANVDFKDFVDLVKIVTQRIKEVRSMYNLKDGEIDWNIFKEMYDICLICNEVVL